VIVINDEEVQHCIKNKIPQLKKNEKPTIKKGDTFTDPEKLRIPSKSVIEHNIPIPEFVHESYSVFKLYEVS